MRILVVDRQPPLDLANGDALIGRHVFSRMARRHELTLVCPAPPDQIESVRAEAAAWFEGVHVIPRATRISTVSGYVEHALARPASGDGSGPASQLVRHVTSLAATGAFDIVHTRHVAMASVTARLSHPAQVLELVDSPSLQARRRLKASSARSIARFVAARVIEGQALDRFPVVTTVSPTDAAMVAKIARRPSVRVVPNGVDTDWFQPTYRDEEPDMVLFVGAMSFQPNVEAVTRFHRDIWPSIALARPAAHFVICGRDPDPAVQALAADPSVTVTRRVDDVRPYLERAAVVVCPMRCGSGIKNKVLEALAMGKAVVSTPLGVEALTVEDGVELRIAPFGAEFASRIIELLEDSVSRRQLGIAGRQYVFERHSWDACAGAYETIYHELAPLTATEPATLPAIAETTVTIA